MDLPAQSGRTRTESEQSADTGASIAANKARLQAAFDTKEIASLLLEGEFATSQGGSVCPDYPVELFIRKPGGDGLNVALPLNEETQEQLRSLCQPADCTVKDEDARQPRHRKGLVLDDDNFFYNFELQSTKILEDIRAALCPLNTFLTAKLDRLHLYATGGFVKQHIDSTIFDPSTFLGILIVVLPSNFEGGELVVDKNGTRGKPTIFDWPEKSKWGPPYALWILQTSHTTLSLIKSCWVCKNI